MVAFFRGQPRPIFALADMSYGAGVAVEEFLLVMWATDSKSHQRQLPPLLLQSMLVSDDLNFYGKV